MDSFYLFRGTQNSPNLQVVANPRGYLDKFHHVWSYYSYRVLRTPWPCTNPSVVERGNLFGPSLCNVILANPRRSINYGTLGIKLEWTLEANTVLNSSTLAALTRSSKSPLSPGVSWYRWIHWLPMMHSTGISNARLVNVSFWSYPPE